MLFIFSNIHNGMFHLLLPKCRLVTPPFRAAEEEGFEVAELSVLRSGSTRAELLPFPSLTLQAGFDSIHKFLPTTLNNAAGEPPVKDKMKETFRAFSRLTAKKLFLKCPWPLSLYRCCESVKPGRVGGLWEYSPCGRSAVAQLNILLNQEKPFTQVSSKEKRTCHPDALYSSQPRLHHLTPISSNVGKGQGHSFKGCSGKNSQCISY